MSNRPIDSKCNTSDPACVKEAWDRAISNDPSPSAYLGLMGEAAKGVGKGLFDAAAFPSDVFYYVTMKDSQFHERRSIYAWGREGISWEDNPLTRGVDVMDMAVYGSIDALSGHLANHIFNERLEWGMRYFQPAAKDAEGLASEIVILPFIYSLARGIGRRAVGAPREAEVPKVAREKAVSQELAARRSSTELRAIPADAGFIDFSFILRSRPVQWLRRVVQNLITRASERKVNIGVSALETLAENQPDPFQLKGLVTIVRKSEVDLASRERLVEAVPQDKMMVRDINPETTPASLPLSQATRAELTKADPKVVSVLRERAKGGDEAAVSELVEMAKTDRRVVSTLYQLAKAGNGAALSALRTLDVTELVEQAKIDSRVVYNLHELAKAGNGDASSALRTLDVTELVKQAQIDPRVIYALYSIAEVGYNFSPRNKAALALKTLDVTSLVEMAKTNRKVVYALRDLARAGNKDAAFALGKMAKTKQVAFKTLFGLAQIGNEVALSALIELAKTNMDAIYALRKLTKGRNKTALSALELLDVTYLVKQAKTNRKVVSVLRDLAHVNNKAVVPALVELARTDPRAVSVLWYDFPFEYRAAARSALRKLDVTKLVEMAKTDRDAITALKDLVKAGNKAAMPALVELAKTNSKAFSALRDLAKAGDEDALSALAELAKTDPRAVSVLQQLAEAKNKLARNAPRPWYLRWVGWLGR